MMITRTHIINTVILFIIIILPLPALCDDPYEIIRTNDVIIQYEKPLRTAAIESAELFPIIKSELEKTFGWRMKPLPVIVLIKTPEVFRKISGNQHVAAMAFPSRNLVVIDYSKMNRNPFQIKITMKHEMCHLLLHHHIRNNLLPRWLNEGIAQWISDGPAELLRRPDQFFLGHAVISKDLVPLNNLKYRFPVSDKLFFMAYEESKSIVEFIIEKYGETGLLEILKQLKNGNEIEAAVQNSLSLTYDEFEKKWIDSLTDGSIWLAYLSLHIYNFVFLFAAGLTVFGFIRFLIKKKAYQDDEDDDDEWV